MPGPVDEDGRLEDAQWLRRAIALAVENAAAGGRPFGAVVVRDGSVVGEGVNRLVVDGDPTAHAEMVAIRNAAATLGTPDLSGTMLAASTEPCPMCQAGALLAGVSRIVYATTDAEATERGYDAREALADLTRPLDARWVMPVEHIDLPEEADPYRPR